MSSLHPVTGTAAEVKALLQDWLDCDRDVPPLVIATSGSTGEPKRVRLSRQAFLASARASQDRLGGGGQWVLNLPPTYVAGVAVLVRSLLAGTEPVVQQGGLAEAIARLTHARRFVSLVHTQLVRALDDPAELAALTTCATVLVGGGPLDAQVRARAEAAGVPVMQTYGMSETCGGCVYDGVPLDGVAVKIAASGEVLLAGPMLFDGYEGDPARTAAVLDGGWFRTADLGHLDEDGRLRIDGRVDDVVISGGVKVPTPAVRRAVLAHPDVRDALVVGVSDAEWGERVVALVVPVPGRPAPALAEVRDLVAPRAWAPRAVVAVDALPLLPNGKPDRLGARRLAESGGGSR